MACTACGNKARRPMRSGVGKQVTQTQPSRTTSGASRGRERVASLRWNKK